MNNYVENIIYSEMSLHSFSDDVKINEIQQRLNRQRQEQNISKQINETKYRIRGIEINPYDTTTAMGSYEYFYDLEGNYVKKIYVGLVDWDTDSIVEIYYPGSKNEDYYAYQKNANGEYELYLSAPIRYVSSNDSGCDSTYSEDCIYFWNKNEGRWNNFSKQRIEYWSPDYLSRYCIKNYDGSSNGTTWVLRPGYEEPYLIEYNDEGYIEKYYTTWYADTSLYEYKYNNDGEYYEHTVFFMANGQWVPHTKATDIQWKEYHGFTYGIRIDSYPNPEFSPFSPNRNKPLSWNNHVYIDGEWQWTSHYTMDWDIDGTLSYSAKDYYVQDGVITNYLSYIANYLFNEHGDFIKYTSSISTYPDEYGVVIERKSATRFIVRTYEEDYGLSGANHYIVNFSDEGTGAPDTTFWGGWQITEFSTTPNIWTSIREYTPTNNTTINIYPNPATNQVTISGIKAGDMITVNDISGRQVMQLRAVSQTQTIDISTLRAGVYVVTTNQSGNMKLVVR